jgi:hypothetical protein
VTRKGTKWTEESIEIPISEFDFQHEFHDLVYGDGEKNFFIWSFHTKETNRLIKVKFVSEEREDEMAEIYGDNIVNNSDILERVKEQYILEKYKKD